MIYTLTEDSLTDLIENLADCSREGARYAAQKIMILVEEKIDIVTEEAEERALDNARAADHDD